MMLEKQIQKSVVDHAKKVGLLAVKFSTGSRFGSNGWPDYQFFGVLGQTFFIEFKSSDGELSPLQQSRVDELRERGFRVYVVRDVKSGRNIIDAEGSMVIK